MNQLVVFLVAGAVFLLLFLLWFLRGQRRESDRTLPLGALNQIVSLRGLAFRKSELLLDDVDCRMLSSRPGLRPLARQLRRDRRRIVSLWFELLQEDIKKLWCFRRLLVRHGVTVGLAEECRIAATAVLALALLFLLRVVVTTAGPFALAHLLRAAAAQVETASRLCADLLSRVPYSTRAQLEREWAAEFAAPAGR